MSDNLDRKLIKSLKKNSRRSLIELSDELYAPESTIRYRINSLIKKGVITKFTIETSGPELSCLIGIKINTKANIKKLYENFLEKGLMEYILETTGEFDCVGMIKDNDIEKINGIIDQVRSESDVLETKSFMVLKEYR